MRPVAINETIQSYNEIQTDCLAPNKQYTTQQIGKEVFEVSYGATRKSKSTAIIICKNTLAKNQKRKTGTCIIAFYMQERKG